MKNILVTTDFSPPSIAGLKVASSIAKRRNNISIRLSHAYHVPRKPSVTNQDLGYDVRKQDEIRANIKEKLQKIAKEDFVKGLKIETQIVPHMDVEQLLEHKDNKLADLIVSGVHGNKDWQRSEEGKHTEGIIRNANCPVLTVPEKLKEPIRFDNIVFASDFTNESKAVFPKLKKVFEILGCRLHLVKIITPHKFENTLHVENEIRTFAKEHFLTNYTIKAFNDESVELGVLRYAYSIHADMIAMETHGNSGFLHLLKGSILESVAHHSDIPVLSMRMQKEI